MAIKGIKSLQRNRWRQVAKFKHGSTNPFLVGEGLNFLIINTK
jgi:hypothetical protein